MVRNDRWSLVAGVVQVDPLQKKLGLMDSKSLAHNGALSHQLTRSCDSHGINPLQRQYDVIAVSGTERRVAKLPKLCAYSLHRTDKRPRGLDALLGHLLVKRIPVTFQLCSTKIPEYLSQK